ncbi:hypothetical protein [Hydrogenophaga sp.]|uniref:InlB B-repeat-containing protein n=1 Tax=Hydrogenophaga sp. TaxID=1904254 RepID=UPI0025BF1B7B|nr:hypothetical protein [Hydrogenophaga sp.]
MLALCLAAGASLALVACGGGGGSAGTEPTPAPTPQRWNLTVTTSGTGTVTSLPSGINCGAACTASFDANARVSLGAQPAQGHSFSGWGGACSGATTTCTVTMSQAQSVAAAFVPVNGATNHSLQVSVNGGGRVTSQPAGINCGATCAAQYASGTAVSLTAAPDAGQTFTGWGGACAGASTTCSVSLTQDRNVLASFAAITATPTWGMAELVEASNDFNVTASGLVYQVNAVSPNGNAMVIWQQPDGQPNGTVSKVYSRLYLAGQGWQPIVQVTDLSDFSNRQLVGGKLFLNDQGAATWVRPNMDARRYTVASGWGAASIAPNKPTGSGSLSAGVVDSAGNLSLVTVGSDVYNISLQANGQWGAWVLIDTSGSLDTDVADIARSSNGSAMAIWAERNPGDSNHSMKAARFDPISGWQAPVTIDNSLDDVVVDSPPRVAMDAAGNALAIWRQGASVWVSAFNPTTGWAAPSAHDTGALASVPLRIRLAMAPDGRAVAAWQSGIYAIKTMTFEPGVGLGAPVEATPYALDRELGIDSQGRATLVYVAVNQWPNPTSPEISVYARRLNWGQPWGAQSLLETQPGGIKTGLAVSFNTNGQGLATWAQNDSATSDVRNSLWSNLLR